MRMRKHLEYFLFLIVRRLVLLLPLRSAQLLGASVGTVAYRCASSRRAVTLDNLAHAFPDKSKAELAQIARGAFRNYGIALFEFLWFPNLTENSLRDLVHCENLHLINDAYARKKGLIVLSGHFGNWELIALATAKLSGHPYAIIVQTQSNGLVDNVINQHRCVMGNKVVPMGISIREIISTLRSGEVVAIAPDQSGPMEGVFVNFFGRMAATHQGPAAFALKTGAPVVMGFLVRGKDGRYMCILEEISTAGLNPNTDEAVRELTQRHTALLEQYIRRYPDHWLWMHRRWKHVLENIPQEKAAEQ